MSRRTKIQSIQARDDRRAWLAMAFDDLDEPYSDLPSVHYDYDSNVQNHKQVKPGDLLFVRSRNSLHGVGRIGRVESSDGEKVVARCPICERRINTGRSTRGRAAFKCAQGHRFEQPKLVAMPVVKYRAFFDGDYFKSNRPISSVELKRFCLRRSNQLAIMPVDMAQIVNFISGWESPEHFELLARWSRQSRKLDESDADEGPDLTPGGEDRRELAMREIRQRRGQQSFRNALLTRYRYRCVVSGCRVVHILEAAHIRPYRGEGDNHVANGLILRSDLHTLFDLDLIGIEPEQGIVSISPELFDTEYENFNGQPLALEGMNFPDRNALRIRWREFCAGLELKRLPEGVEIAADS
ncbi:HNH endonuclease [Bradyrhizobium yuanmingense]|uniref:HNH endonuclease n=1 Tax=Bradyrhizobium yuanmingense TaxID=108015 RepID=UPI001AEF2F3F|nr:HNH endonuclease [Bradyrhizobium yuanmingense]